MLIKASKFVPAEVAEQNFNEYLADYKESVENPNQFWAGQAERLYWHKKWDVVKNTTYSPEVSIKWFEGGKLNVCYNCVDRHLKERGDDVAILWESDDAKSIKKITYNELYDNVCRVANVLKKHGISKGDRVTIYMPMIPEAVYSMLACTRIGAVHSVVFGGFSPESLRGRMDDCNSSYVITADEGLRGGKKVPLKANVDDALRNIDRSVKVLVFKHTASDVPWTNGRDLWYHEECDGMASDCPPEIMDAEDPLFILYTSGSTGKPKGALHTTGGYLVYASLTHEKIFGYERGDIYWCTADIGWITGHSYLVYGPLSNGATTLVFEGVPSHPTPSRIWQTIDRHKVNILYTAPTLIRALEREGDKFVKETSRKSLKLLASVGEPINPEAWMWYFRICGDDRCPVIDTWWQTETGGILIAPLPYTTDLKPGSATLPFFGVQPVIVDQQGVVLEGECEGALCIKDSWPGQMRTVYGDHKRFFDTYFSQFKGLYFSGDGAKRDSEGFYWITGRMDDVIKISGHRIGTAEIESALVLHDVVSEAAVVGYPHDIKGQGIYAFVTLSAHTSPSDKLEKELKEHVAKHIGPIARPDIIQWAPNLPKTRSGKIMRRILRKIAEGDFENMGDTSTLMSPEAVTELIAGKKAA